MNEIRKKIQEIDERLSGQGEAGEIYAYLFELGKKQNKGEPKVGSSYHRLAGCRSITYVECKVIDDKVLITGYSQSLMIAGIIGLIAEVYNDQSVAEACTLKPDWWQELFGKYFSLTKLAGIEDLVAYLRGALGCPHIRLV